VCAFVLFWLRINWAPSSANSSIAYWCDLGGGAVDDDGSAIIVMRKHFVLALAWAYATVIRQAGHLG
jgi:hypothetical protein